MEHAHDTGRKSVREKGLRIIKQLKDTTALEKY